MILKTVIAFIVLLISRPLFGQHFSTALELYNNTHPQEKIYLHNDKDYYTAGETLWFKAYLLHNGKPSTISHHLFMVLADASGKQIASGKYPVAGATVRGDLLLPDSIQQGWYQLKAYTPAVLNSQTQELVSARKFFVFHPDANSEISIDTSRHEIRLAFFPESGNLVDGLLTVVGFKATDDHGLPVEVQGEIRSDDGFTVPFRTSHDGMGKTLFRAYSRKKYTAFIQGSTQAYALPEVLPSGINLTIQDEKNGKTFVISRSKNKKEDYQKLILVAQINNTVVYENEINFDEYYSIKGHLITDSLPSGILHFTVFNNSLVPMAERLCFVDNGEYRTDAKLINIREDLGRRGENSMEILFADSAQKSLSVSVTDVSVATNQEKESIISHFLLTSDLKGRIYNPQWYFENTSENTRQELDHLLLTQGWSRFKWEKVLAAEVTPPLYEDPYLLTVKGRVKDEKGREVKGGVLRFFLESNDSIKLNYEVIVQDDGKFRLDSLLFYGKTRIFYQYLNQGESKTISLMMDSIPGAPALDFPALSDYTLLKKYTPSRLPADFNDHPGLPASKEMEEVVLKAKSRRPFDQVNEKYTSSLFRSPGKLNLDNINQPANDRALGVIEYIINNVRQVEYKGDKFVSGKNRSLFKHSDLPTPDAYDGYGNAVGSSETKSDKRGPVRAKEPPANGNAKGEQYVVDIFLNEIPVDLASLRSLRMDEIALIKYYDPGFIGSSSSGSGGTIAVYTKQQDYEPVRAASKQNFVLLNGYTISREFYQPDYSSPDAGAIEEDRRSTLYWNPSVFLDKDTKSYRLKFYNNDLSKKLKLVVEGFSADGKLVHIEKIIGG